MSEDFISVSGNKFVSKYPIIIVGRERPLTYATEIIIRMNQGVDKIVIVSKGINISKLAVVYNIVKSKLREVLETESIVIGSMETPNRRLVSYMAILLSRKV